MREGKRRGKAQSIVDGSRHIRMGRMLQTICGQRIQLEAHPRPESSSRFQRLIVMRPNGDLTVSLHERVVKGDVDEYVSHVLDQ